MKPVTWISILLILLYSSVNHLYSKPVKQDKLEEMVIIDKNMPDLNTLNVDTDRENLARRGEIIFFSSFSYLWLYQFLFFDILFSTFYGDGLVQGELNLTNLLFSIGTSILMALMVTRKDSLYIKVEKYHEQPYKFLKQPIYPLKDKFHIKMNFFTYYF